MAKKTGTAVVKWDEELAKEAKALAATEKEAGGRKFITHKDGQLYFAGAEIPDNELSVVILGVVHENQYYEDTYREGEFQIPACFAFGMTEDEMEPHELAQKPQCEGCEGCPLNEWGSADVGEGKACKNVRRFAMISSADLEDLEHAEVAYLKLPVTSVKHWAAYMKKTLEKIVQKPYWGVVTKISLDGKEFDFALDKDADDIDPKLFPQLKEMHATALEELPFPYEPLPEAAKKKKAAKPKGKARKGFGKRGK